MNRTNRRDLRFRRFVSALPTREATAGRHGRCLSSHWGILGGFWRREEGGSRRPVIDHGRWVGRCASLR